MASTVLPTPPETFVDPDRYEVINGVRQELPPMGAREANLASLLTMFLGTYVWTHRLGGVHSEMLFRIDPSRELQRRPDVAYVSAEKWPFGRLAPDGAAWEIVPDVAVEIVSPSNTVVEVQGKIRDYFNSGVTQVWVVHPQQDDIYVYESPTRVRILTREDELTAEPLIPGFRLPLRDLFLSAPIE